MSKTVQELRDELDELIARGEGDMQVGFAYNYGDYWRTTVVQGINNLALVTVTHSEYHRMDKVVDNDEEFDGEPNPNHRTVYVLE